MEFNFGYSKLHYTEICARALDKLIMNYNLCLLPKDEKYKIQLDYEASHWAYQIKKGQKTRDKIYAAILARPMSEQDYLKQQFERFLSIM